MNDKKKLNSLFSVIFKDGTYYSGSDNNFDTGWLNIPNKPIKRVFYRLPDGNHICLANYEKYNRIVEATNDLSGKLKGKTIIRYIYFMGLKKDIVTSYRVVMFEVKPDKIQGNATRREYNLGKEWYNGATTGWK